ncbi:DNA topoisomerase-1 [Neolewinella xylanilytica]|uniref:DNA topoisomerase n=1 Tax=Neolewinella xylanilytica TaxID=1514080 RepID=A0A2S6HZX6_9BACT|nr:DNA topoisomerase IB [Neolewinella xylanilytica]PPK84078.1 DNA topoisomerase-1 [Neolewinella xylanilytica]
MGAAQENILSIPDLVHVSDDQPGWTRKRAKKGFRYYREDGTLIKDKLIQDRLASLAIPPAWADVWICPLENGHLLSTGRDEAGRKQYRYHPDWMAFKQLNKFNTLIEFADALPGARRTLRGILQDESRGWGLERVGALAIAMMDETGMRVGNSSYRKRNGTIGLTTLRRKHVEVDDNGFHFEYTGKSGIERAVDLTDPTLVDLITNISELPGYEVFRFRGEDGKMHNLDSSDVNHMVRQLLGAEFSSKYFRTWAGTAAAVDAYWELKEENDGELPDRPDLRVVERVAEFLGNTVSVCRKYYIHPSVLAAVAEERVPDESTVTKKEEAKFDGEFDHDEIIAYRLACG